MMRILFQSFILLIPTFFIGIESQQLDPVKNMCLRFDHQAVIKNRTLYIDGGRQTFVDLVPGTDRKQATGNVTVTEGYNNNLIAIDLSTTWSATNVFQNAIPKFASAGTQSLVPVLSRGALYSGRSDDDNIYLWGGTTSPWNESFPGYVPPAPPQNSLWSFSQVSQRWDAFDTGQMVPNRPNSGPSAEAPDLGLGFFLNGGIDDHSQAADGFRLASESKPFLQGMIVIDTVNKTARNISTAAVTGDKPMSRGKMEYVKNVGSKGILVVIGGNRKNVHDYSNQFVGDQLPMDQIFVFDVASYYNASTPDGVWYNQRATGDIPERRIDHCVIVASAPDNSSHNIYVVGGRSTNGTDNIFFDDVHVLSIPSFTWTKIYQGVSPTYAHQCVRANSRMMIKSGGASSFSYDSLPCDDRASGLSVYDISDNKWSDIYDSSPQPYMLPTRVVDRIGGNRTGGATKLKPDNGFDQDGLIRLFAKKPTQGSRRKLPSAPFIIAGVLGSVAIVGVAGAFFFTYRRRLKNFVVTGSFRVELDGESPLRRASPDKAEMDATPARLELPGAGPSATPMIKYVEPCGLQPVELCVNECDLPWRELQPRESYVLPAKSYRTRTLNGELPPAWEPPITPHGVPF